MQSHAEAMQIENGHIAHIILVPCNCCVHAALILKLQRLIHFHIKFGASSALLIAVIHTL